MQTLYKVKGVVREGWLHVGKNSQDGKSVVVARGYSSFFNDLSHTCALQESKDNR